MDLAVLSAIRGLNLEVIELEKLKISLAAARVNAELTQEEVAKKIGVTKQTIINWEKGRIEPSLAAINMLSNIYGISVDNFLMPK